MIIAIRSALFNAAFYVWTALVAILWLPALLGPRGWVVTGQRLWASGVMALLQWLAGVSFEIRGRERLPQGGVLIASKHQSAWDTIIYHLLLRDPAVVLKRELLSIPIYGWYCRKARMIAVDRKGGGKALRRMIRSARSAAETGREIVIFPEGTRAAPGDAEPIQPGVAGLYGNLGVACVPVALNSGLFWPRRRFIRRPGVIVLEFLPAIQPGLERAVFVEELANRIGKATDGLIAEARTQSLG